MFHSDSITDNIFNPQDLEILYDFPKSLKKSFLSKITDVAARNLLSNLLNKDPKKRLITIYKLFFKLKYNK